MWLKWPWGGHRVWSWNGFYFVSIFWFCTLITSYCCQGNCYKLASNYLQEFGNWLFLNFVWFLLNQCDTHCLVFTDYKMITASCGCLNVTIHIKGDKLVELLRLSDDLEPVESYDEFFQQVICCNILKVKMYSMLIITIEHNFIIYHFNNSSFYNIVLMSCFVLTFRRCDRWNWAPQE